LLSEIATAAEHLHHMDLKMARKSFRTISHAVVTLATEARGSEAAKPFVHFFCPHVKGGGGDWLQDDGKLFNPYFGSEMLRCGEQVNELPLPDASSSPESTEAEDVETSTK